jgi:curved DNA-binding protein
VPTIDGAVTMKVPPRTQSGQKLRLRGKGIARRNQEAGDLYVHFQVRVPEAESPEITAAIEALALAQPSDPREGIAL